MKLKALVLITLILAFFLVKPVSAQTYNVDTKESSIKWKASKIGGSHNGTINLSSGNLIFDGKNLKSGNFVIDMTSIAILDLSGTSNQNLLKHLKSDDFFSVETNPTSAFKVTKITSSGGGNAVITGNLTIKGITNAITFPATLKQSNNMVSAIASNVKVDRTKYDIKYRSKSFFGDIGDKAIDDEFELSITLVAKK